MLLIKSGSKEDKEGERVIGTKQIYAYLLLDERRSEEDKCVGWPGNMRILLFIMVRTLERHARIVRGITVDGRKQERVGFGAFWLLWGCKRSFGHVGGERDRLRLVEVPATIN